MSTERLEPVAETDGCLSPLDCARWLGVSDEYIRGEIKDGRLKSRERRYASGRRHYRIEAADWHAYLEKHWPHRHAST